MNKTPLHYIIYKAINLVNNKIYIGKTKHSLEQRIKQHLKTSKQNERYFQRALKKYNKDCFLWSVEYKTNNYENLNKKEKYFIKLYNSNNINLGYNLTEGGEGLCNPSKNTRIKISKGKLGKKNPNYKDGSTSLLIDSFCNICGKKIQNKRVKLCKSCCKLGIKKSDSHRKNISISKMGDKNPAKQQSVKNKLIIHNLKFIYNARGYDKEYFGIWNLRKFCIENGLNLNTVKTKMINKNPLEVNGWTISREEKIKQSSKFFSNYFCEYYPCHSINQLNCLTCFCPLYHICGSKDCINCVEPHKLENYDTIIELLTNEI